MDSNKQEIVSRVLDNHPLESNKRGYIRKDHKEHLKTFAEINYDKYELKELGLLRPVLKQQCVEIAARANAEVTHRLRNPEKVSNLRTTDLIGIASIATKHLIELEAQVEAQKEIDWDKFDVDKFNGEVPKLGTNQPQTPN